MNTYNIQFTAHLTESHQLKAADALIAKLKMEKGANQAYIEELELENAELKSSLSVKDAKINELDELVNKLRKEVNKTSSELVDEKLTKRNSQIKMLEAEVKALKDVRDQLIGELNKYRG